MTIARPQTYRTCEVFKYRYSKQRYTQHLEIKHSAGTLLHWTFVLLERKEERWGGWGLVFI